MANKNKKIVKYRRPRNINVGMIIFAIIFVYMLFSVYTYMSKEKVQFYEVVDGSIVNNKEYQGIILRQEDIYYTDRAGYVNYYIREGKRASVGTRIYSIDESGNMKSFLENNQSEQVNLNHESLTDIKKQLSSYAMNFRNEQFTSVYDLQYTLEALIMEYVSFNTLENLDALLEQSGLNFQQVRSEQAGVISYGIDGYEQLNAAAVTEASFNRSNYSRTAAKAGELIASGSPVYKIITNDNWSVVFLLTGEEAAEYAETQTLSVKFTGENLTAEGAFSMFTGTDGNQYGKLDFNQYMVQFISDRFIDFEIVSDKVEGLKIPVSAVTTKLFYLVPAEYLSHGGNSSVSGFMKEIYSENGTSVEFIPTELYYSNDEYYYIDMSENSLLKAGDYVVKENSTERYQIGQSASLQGVYNINKGYAVFKQIDILNSNDEYYTIRKGMNYGLTVYDHIVLDANTVYEGKLVYQ